MCGIIHFWCLASSLVALDVLVLQVEGVLPHVELEDRGGAGRQVVLVVVELQGLDAPAQRVPQR